MERRNVLKIAPAILGGFSAGKVAEACATCEQGKISSSHPRLKEELLKYERESDILVLKVHHSNLKVNHRHLQYEELSFDSFDIDPDILELVDSIEITGYCGASYFLSRDEGVSKDLFVGDFLLNHGIVSIYCVDIAKFS